MPWLFPSIVACLSGTLVLFLVYIYLYATYHERFLGIWAASWGLYALRFIANLAMLVQGNSPFLLFVSEASTTFSAFLLLSGTSIFVSTKTHNLWVYGTGFALIWTAIGIYKEFPFVLLTTPSYLLTAAIFIWMGYRIFKSDLPSGTGKAVITCTMVLWGLHKLNYPFLRHADWFAPWGFLLGGLFSMTAALGILLLYFEKTRNELIFSEARSRKLFEDASYGIVLTHPETGIILDCNNSFAAMLRMSREEMIGKKQHAWHYLDGNQNDAYNASITISTGESIYVEINSQIVNYRHQVVQQSFVQDITDRKRAEEEKNSLEESLRRAEKMEALGQLAGGVAHDLNNVLGILSGYSELLLMEFPEESKLRGYVEKILQSTGKGAAIVQDLLTLARRGVTVADVVNLNTVIEGFLKTPVFEKIKEYHPRVTFRTECARNLLSVKGSALHLEKTVMNLVSNAAEAISGEGEIVIRTQNRYLDRPLRGYDEVNEGDYVLLTVSDTGMGIPDENIEKIFEPFYTKKKMGRSGTGLGLAIVWGTVKDLNGYIDVESKVDEGTTFTLYFPVTREEMTAQPQQEPMDSYRGRGETVLVVDDIAEQREIASRLLEKLGYQVHAVSGGEAAVEYLKANKADIMILDMIMAPGIDGLETWQRVRKISPQQKVIIVSGFSETDRAKEAHRLGTGAYVKKPYILEKIGIAIREELNRK